MKIAYIGFDLFYAALEAFFCEGCDIIKIFSYRTDDVYEFNRKTRRFAEDRGIDFTEDRITEKDIIELERDGCELIVSAGYIYRIPTGGNIPLVNIHPALLPVGRGAWPMPCTILKGLRTSGVTIHKTVKELDAGDVLLRESFEVDGREDLESLIEKQQALLPDMIHKLVGDFEELYKNATPQKDYPETPEYWAEPDDPLRTLTDEMDDTELDRRLRAFYGYGCLYRRSDEGIVELDRHATLSDVKRSRNNFSYIT